VDLKTERFGDNENDLFTKTPHDFQSVLYKEPVLDTVVVFD
jgi:hypothetical protein